MSNEGKYWDEGIMLVKGCTPVSEGCDHCWSKSMNAFTHGQGDFDQPRFDEKQLARFGKGKPRIISIWNDLFHECVTDEQIAMTLGAMAGDSQNIYLILTKRPERIATHAWAFQHYADHIWLGVTAENQARWDERVPQLLAANPAHPWVMCEPLLGQITFAHPVLAYPMRYPDYVKQIQWIVAGLETGKDKRIPEMSATYRLFLKLQAAQAGIPFWGKAGYSESDRAYPAGMKP